MFHKHNYEIIHNGYKYCKCGDGKPLDTVFLHGYEGPRVPYKEPDPTPAQIKAEKERQAKSREYGDAFLEAQNINSRNFQAGRATFYTADDVLKKRRMEHYNSPPPPLVSPAKAISLYDQISRQLQEQEEAALRQKQAQEEADYKIWLDNAG